MPKADAYECFLRDAAQINIFEYILPITRD